jgi:dihydropteroate synthase
MTLSQSPASVHRHLLIAKGRDILSGGRPLIMGIVNVTSDSFYDGGRYLEPERAIAHAVDLVEQGADLIDIGAESTRPGAVPIDEQDELDRVIPVIEGVARRVAVPISVDTMKARVAQRAVDAGASMVNDVSALRFDAGMAEVVAQSGAGVVLMHMQGTPQTMQQAPQYQNVVAEVTGFFEERLQAAMRAGIEKSHIVLDPGIGFGKLLSHNLVLLTQLSSFAMFDRPLLVGLSRKAFIGQIIDRPVAHREWGTAAAVAIAVERGADILRVHDVAMMADVVKVASALRARPFPSGSEHHA